MGWKNGSSDVMLEGMRRNVKNSSRNVSFVSGERKAGGAETKIYVIMHRKIDVPGDGVHNGNM